MNPLTQYIELLNILTYKSYNYGMPKQLLIVVETNIFESDLVRQ